MYLLKWKYKIDGKTVFLSTLSRNLLDWGPANKAKRFSSPEELIRTFNEIYVGTPYISGGYCERYTKIVYIHPLNIPQEKEKWID